MFTFAHMAPTRLSMRWHFIRKIWQRKKGKSICTLLSLASCFMKRGIEFVTRINDSHTRCRHRSHNHGPSIRVRGRMLFAKLTNIENDDFSDSQIQGQHTTCSRVRGCTVLFAPRVTPSPHLMPCDVRESGSRTQSSCRCAGFSIRMMALASFDSLFAARLQFFEEDDMWVWKRQSVRHAGNLQTERQPSSASK